MYVFCRCLPVLLRLNELVLACYTYTAPVMNNAYDSPIFVDLGGAEYPDIFLDELGREAE